MTFRDNHDITLKFNTETALYTDDSKPDDIPGNGSQFFVEKPG
jgi:hypothetical protein